MKKILTLLCNYKIIILGLMLFQKVLLAQCGGGFTYTTNYNGCSINLLDQSFGSPTSWYWEFGDGAISDEQNPTHNYNEPGCYDVYLRTTVSGVELEYAQEICVSCVDDNTGTGSFNVSINGPSTVYWTLLTDFSSTVSGGVAPYSFFWELTDESGNSAFLCAGNEYSQNPEMLFTESCILNATYTLTLTVTDADGNISSADTQVTIDGIPPTCEIKVSGSQEVGGTVKFRIKGSLIGVDCFDVYRFWTWDFGDGESTDSNWGWDAEHVYLGNDTQYTVTAIGCPSPTWEGSGDCVELTGSVEIGDPPPIEVSPRFSMSSDQIMATVGVPISLASLNVDVNNLPIDIPGDFTIDSYELIWRFRDSYSQEMFSYTLEVMDVDPTVADLESILNNASFTPTIEMYGCLDVILEIYPWGYYNGPIDVDGDGDVDLDDHQCYTGGNFNLECNGKLGVMSNWVNLGIGYYQDGWDIQSSFSGIGYVGDDVTAYGENFPFIISQNCKIDVRIEPLEVTDIIINDGCSPYLEVVAELGGAGTGSPPSGSPCSSQQRYKTYTWKAFGVDEFQTEIEDFYLGNTNSKCVRFDREHAYFQQFQSSQTVAFIAEITVEDYYGSTESYTKLVGIDQPININIPNSFSFCPGTVQIPLYDGTLFSGGTEPYDPPLWIGPIHIFNEPFDPFNPVLDLQPNEQGPFSFEVILTDGSNCSTSKPIIVEVNPISVQVDSESDEMCVGEGLFNSINAEVTGGTGNYEYEWESDPTNVLDNLSSPNPNVTPTTLDAITFQVTVTDDTGCSSTDQRLVKVGDWLADGNINVQPDMTVCNGGEKLLVGTLTGPPPNKPPSYFWTSNHPLSVEKEGLIYSLEPEETNQSGLFTYTLVEYNPINGCFREHDSEVEILEPWTYTGYESEIKTFAEGIPGASLWTGTNNEILSGPVGDLTYSWAYNNTYTYDIINNANGIPAQTGFFVPTPSDPFLTLHVKDEENCRKKFRTNRYLTVEEEEPFIHMNVEPTGSICLGDEYCINILFYSNYSGENPALLPPTVSCHVINVDSDFQLNLVDGSVGIYEGQLCRTRTPQTSLPSYKTIITDGFWSDEDIEATVEVHNGSPETLGYVDVCHPFGSFSGYGLGLGASAGNGTCSPSTFPPYEATYRGGLFVSILPHSGIESVSGSRFTAFINSCMELEQLTDDDQKIITNDTTEQRSSEIVNNEDLLSNQNLFLEIQPNPFSNSFEIKYAIEAEDQEEITIELFYISGKLVGQLYSGVATGSIEYGLRYDGTHLPPGVYFCRMQTAKAGSVTKRIVKINK
jgi:hypothetical protein